MHQDLKQKVLTDRFKSQLIVLIVSEVLVVYEITQGE